MPTQAERIRSLVQNTPDEDSGMRDVSAETDKMVKGLGTGVAQMLGMPRFITDAVNSLGGIKGGIADITGKIPSGEQIQQYFADYGIAYSPGEEPKDILYRTYENIGAGLIPLGITGKLKKAGPMLTEVGASAGGAVGGRGLEETQWGEEHPTASRAIGEIAGGLTGGGVTAVAKQGGGVGAVYRGGKKAVQSGFSTLKGPGARKRAVRRFSDVSLEPETSAKRSARMATTEEGSLLTPVQASADERLARLRMSVEEEIPEIGAEGVKQRSKAFVELSKKLIKNGDISDMRQIVDAKLQKYAGEARDALNKIDKSLDPAAIQTQVINKLDEAYKEARKAESLIWQSLPEDIKIRPENLMGSYKDELSNITRGGDINEIDQFARRKLGVPRKLKKEPSQLIDAQGRPLSVQGEAGEQLVGGQLIKDRKKVTAKELHQFYSRLGRRVRELKNQEGNPNKIRILNRLRQNVLTDLDATEAGEEYRQALNFSKDLNKKFTDGAVGKMLGFARGRAPSETQALDVVMGQGGQAAKEAVEQAVKANPWAARDITDYIRTQFVLTAKNQHNNRINTKTAETFIKKFEPVLDFFPGLKRQFRRAADTQREVDQLAGVSEVTDLSPLTRERTAASVMIQAPPGEEMANILSNKNLRPRYLKDLVKLAAQDKTGKAKKGLQAAFGQELLKFSKMSNVKDEITGMSMISGRRMDTRLRELMPAIENAGLFNKQEINRLKRIVQAFKGIENELKAMPLKEGILNDIPSKLLQRPAQIFGARAGGSFSSGNMGGSLQTANILSSEAKDFTARLTNDEARNIVIYGVQDQQLFNDLFTEITAKNKEKVWKRIIDKAQTINKKLPSPPVSAGAPAATTIAQETPESEKPSQAARIRELVQ